MVVGGGGVTAGEVTETLAHPKDRKNKLGGKSTETGSSDWRDDDGDDHQTLGVGGWGSWSGSGGWGGVTCQVMHQIFNKVSHYGISCYDNQHQAHEDVDYIGRQIYSISCWRYVVHEVGLLLLLLLLPSPPEQLEEPPVLGCQAPDVAREELLLLRFHGGLF